MWMLFSQIADSEAAQTVFRWSRIQENRDWFLPLLVLGLLIVYFVRRYRIDAAELAAWQRLLLLFLRSAALLCLLLFYLHPQWEHLIGSSRVAVLVDTSASMALRDLTPENEQPTMQVEDAEPSEGAAGPSRLEAVVDWMQRSELLGRLGEKHDVALYAFDKTLKEAASPSETANEGIELRADGEQTALGEALFEILQRERGRPLAGIVLVTDGRQNAGRAPETSLEMATRLQIPIYPVGIGALRQPINFRVGNVDVPERVFPDDPFIVKVPIELVGGDEEPQNRTVPVELWLQPEGAAENDGPGMKIAEKEVLFSTEKPGSPVVEANFEVRIPETGRRRLTVKIVPPKEDRHPADDQQQAELEIVDRKDRMLLFASAPTRDYQFLCSQINRDKSMAVDVYLPWAKPGASQNADKILPAFPSTRTDMSQYDVVVAFDVNWRDLSGEQIDVLEHWVARQGGGLILIAGAINQADTVSGWTVDPGMEKIRALYPVEFLAKQSTFDHRYHADTQAWPLQFTRSGQEAEFLRPVDDPVEARTFWSEFPGFYGFFAVRAVKPTATLLASSGSPETMSRNETGALIVEQFYGAGRVLYFGSGELWRLRRVDERSFEQIATRMLRHVAQGRLQRDSDRGSLATDKRRYSLGSIAQLRVTANDAQLKPLTLPTLPLDLQSPSGTLRTIDVMLDPNVPGTYLAHVPLAEEGTWTAKLTVPDGGQEITRTFQVQMSDLERENPSRNEPLLRELADRSGGAYYASPVEALPYVKESGLYGDVDFFGDASDPEIRPLTERIKVRSLQAVADQAVEEKMMRVFLLVICSLLMLEWTFRRLMKLA